MNIYAFLAPYYVRFFKALVCAGFFALILGVVFPSSARATNRTWTGGGTSNLWSQAANWGASGVPTNGDTVVFPSGQLRATNSNNLTNLVLNQILFTGGTSAYVLLGNTVTITNGIEATNTSGFQDIQIAFTNNLGGVPTNFVIDVATNVTLAIEGAIIGSADVTKIGAGVLRFDSDTTNPYSGATRVNAGILQLNDQFFTPSILSPVFIGTGSGPTPTLQLLGPNQLSAHPVTINKGTLDLNGNNSANLINTITMLGSSAITTGAGVLSLANGATIFASGGFGTISGNLNIGSTTFTVSNQFVLTINANITGSSGIFKTGSGDLHFAGTNTYSGSTTVNQGILFVDSATALGGTNSGTVVNNGGSLSIDANVTITNESLSLTGPGSESDFGTLDSSISPGSAAWLGPITINGPVTISPTFTNTTLQLLGPISGNGSITVGVEFDEGTVEFDGSISNSYTGSTLVPSNVSLQLNKGGIPSVPHNLEIVGTVRMLANNNFNFTSDILVDAGGLFDLNGHFASIDTLHGSGQVHFGTGGYVIVGTSGGSSTFDGVMSGTGVSTPGGYTVGKFGGGTFTMTATNTYQGVTGIYAGTVVVNGTQTSPVFLGGGTISGNGSVGGISGSGTIAPGNSVGVLTSVSNIVGSATMTNVFDITGPLLGAGGYDRISASGRTNTLANTVLVLNQAVTNPLAIGNTLIIASAQSVTGTYNGLPNNSVINVGGYTYNLNYIPTAAILTVSSIPGALAGSSVASGNGNHAIDPNECNNLYFAISNRSGATMTGVSASLSTPTARVFITQPNADYPSIPAAGVATNLGPFQLSTLSNFNCGDPISLTLSISSSQGAFSVPITLQTGSPASPLRYNNNTNTSIPDVGSIDSTNVVAGFTGPVEKVTVSLFITHTFDSDLTNISLVGPDNTTVLLAASEGSGGVNFGSATNDVSRTVFDDSAALGIDSGSAPFVGTFIPKQPLSGFIGKTGAAVNGNWKLHIADGFGGSLGTLRAWSLFLSPVSCVSGGGYCTPCFGLVTNTIGAGDLLNSNHLVLNSVASSCAAPKTCPGIVAELNHYDVYYFTNFGPTTCLTVSLQNACGNLSSSAYLGIYSTNNPCSNYLGDTGDSASSYSFNVPAQAVFSVIVNEVPSFGPGCDYALLVNSGDCQPKLAIARDPSGTNLVHLSWPSSVGGYNLEAATNLFSSSWLLVTNEPVINSGNYNVTNTETSTDRFYRLHKP